MPFTNIQTYLEQWLATATGGKISVAIAWNQPRMRLVCHTCQATYTSPTPTDTTIDYGVQQFVELHSHKGGYEKPTGIWEGADVVPATLDFKRIAGIQNGLAQYHAPIKNAGGEILKIAKGRKFR